MVHYNNEETVLTYADFDSNKGSFTLNSQQIRLDAHDYPTVLSIPSAK